MAEQGRAGPLALPETWLHADGAPSWGELADTAVLFVRWRLDRWDTLERLHELDRRARDVDGAAVAVGLHPDRPVPLFREDRVRQVLLARGTWAPTGLDAPGGTPAGPAEPGAAVLVVDGEVAASFDASRDVESVTERLVELAPPGEPSWRPRGASPGPWPLAFPCDVAVGGSRLAVADTGHNRVVVARPGGEITGLVGDGVPEHRDGTLTEARFEAPRGLCWRGEQLLVADTGNDAIRAVDLSGDRVRTLARAPQGSLPAGLAARPDGEVLVALAGAGALGRLDGDDLAILETAEGGLGHPVDVVEHDADVLVADLEDARLHRVELDEASEAVWKGDPLVEPAGLLGDGDAVLADAGRRSLFGWDDSGPAELSKAVDTGSLLAAPHAVDREADKLVVADGGGHHLWRFDPNGEADPERVRLTESPLSLAEHIRLDPIEVAPGALLELAISYVLASGDSPVPERPQAPRARGPVRELETAVAPTREEGRVRTELHARVAASGSLRIRWSLTAGDVGHEAAWDLPIVVRPGADEGLRLALSTSPP